ncbi:ATP-dependent zinc metalloprotease ftsh chloroplastic/mitochondrial-like, partial [Trifolium pratense]
MATLQTSLLSKPLLPFLIPNHSILKPHNHFTPTRLHPRVPFTPLLCTFHPDNTTVPHSEPNPNNLSEPITEPITDSADVESINSLENDTVVTVLDSNLNESRFEGVVVDGESEKKDSKLVENDGRLPIVVFLIGLWVRAKKSIERAFSELFDWWPFWRQEKRLAKLISEADANRDDAVKQSALFVELNKHSPESVIKRFEERDRAVDSRGVAEYLRALVITNAIAEYLPDEESGKPSGLPSLLQDLKQRASGNTDETFLNPGISEKQPLHVVMVDQKVSNKSRFANELFTTIVCTVAIGLIWLVGTFTLQKYVGGLGGIGSSGVGSSSSYTPKEQNKEVMPEK